MPFVPTRSCLADMPSPVGRGQASIVNDPEINEWSGLLVNEQEVAVHPVQAVDLGVVMAASNSIELTPLWPKNNTSPSHKGWPADHRQTGGKHRGERGPPPPPPPSSCPPAVPQKSKNQPPPAPPPLPVTSSKDLRKQLRPVEVLEAKGPAPQPPVTTQPIRSSSVSRGLQVEEDDLIQFSNGQKAVNGVVSTSTSVAQLKKQLRSRLSLAGDDDIDPEFEVDEDIDDDDNESISSKTADEQMDYLESLEPCPCYAKCCLDSVISLFCVTLLG